MAKYDWESNIKMNILMLKILGIWPKGEDTYTLGLYMLHASFLLAVFLFSHIFFQAVNMYFIRDDLAALTGTIYVVVVEMVMVSKLYYVIKNMKMLKQLLRILDTDMFQPQNSVQIEAIEESIWYWKMIYQGYLLMCFGCNAFWIIFPMMDKSSSEEKRLPFLAWYPYNAKESPMYEITYFHQISSVVYITCVHANIDALVAALNVFNGSQFDILCDNLRNLHILPGSPLRNLINCIQHHKEILSFADKSNNFLNWILFLQFFVSAISIGLTMFQLTLVVPMSSEFYSLVAYGFAMALQIFMYCWFGNEVQVKSSNIPYAAFQCEWTDFSEELKKNLLFFTLRSQKPVKLSALNLFDLSLDTFMKIMKTSWSYFALLHQVNAR